MGRVADGPVAGILCALHRGHGEGLAFLDPRIFSVIHRIHDCSVQAALAISGGGSQALAWLLAVPGATRTVLEVTLPYSYAAFDRFIGFQPVHYVSPETSVILATTAYRRAR